ncbi:hypothetical protein PsorP6_009600 [Peronosclerospora sorghi]|uniref:Uncharacterized protein n=1 Tax=Peronosclerospora sorghi TaxID=230839 RepID=A0ACC0VXQ0_9STRA|nr:hypothetical protein PsorP6_009600 [Peronosclerospora sorghi]
MFYATHHRETSSEQSHSLAASHSRMAGTFHVSGVRVAQDPVKGNVVVSERAFKPGQVIFSEEAFVAASWSTEVCGGCEELRSLVVSTGSDESVHGCYCERTGAPKAMYPSRLQDNVDRRHVVVSIMKTIDGIDEVDRARCILKCLALYERDANALADVMGLTCTNKQRACDAAAQLRRQVPDVFPAGFSDDEMATLIGVLNTNSHELENLGGSGLFLSACRLEHSCIPNCSFTTFGSTLWVTAIRPVAPGTALSIDYGNFFYRPTPERQEALLESYGFVCTCESCVSMPDPTRAACCQSSSCPQGSMLPYPLTRSTVENNSTEPSPLRFEWRCQTCGKVANATEQSRILAAEQELMENGFPESLDAIDGVVRRGVLHERHYLLFWALDSIGCEAAQSAAYEKEAAPPRQALAAIWERLIRYMNEVLPFAHHEKTIYYDNLAQVYVVLGDLAAASEAYARAYEISCLVSGTDCLPTRKLQKLMERPPQTADELRKLYADEARQRLRPQSADDDMRNE